MKTSRKRLYYKLARLTGKRQITLQRALTNAFKSEKLRLASARTLSVDASNASFRVVHYHSPYKTMLVGEMLEYADGDKPVIAKIGSGKESFELETAKIPTGSQFIHSLLHFGVSDNNLIIIQGASLRAKQFEHYVNWILQESGSLTEEEYFALTDLPPRSVSDKVQNATKITISSPVHFRETTKESKAVPKSNELTVKPAQEKPTGLTKVQLPSDKEEVRNARFIPSGPSFEALRSFFPSSLRLPTELNVEQMLANRELMIELSLRWVRPRRDDSTTLMDGIATQLRHIDDDIEFEIETKDGKITRDEIKCTDEVSIGVTDGGLLKRDEVWARMRDWLERLLESKRIPANP